MTAYEEEIENRFGYTGEQFDAITKQYYLRARFYNPVVARFTQEDTYRGDGLNLYAYCANNPVGYVDPSGNTASICEHKANQYQQKLDKGEELKREEWEELRRYNRAKDNELYQLERELGISASEAYRRNRAKEANAVYPDAEARGAKPNKVEPFDIVKYGDKTPGIENHHGILDVWARNNIPGYVGRAKDSPSIALTAGKEGQHAATKAVYRDWLFEKTGKKVGGVVDWTNVSPREMHDLSEKMFDAAGVPSSARENYYREFYKYIYGLD